MILDGVGPAPCNGMIIGDAPTMYDVLRKRPFAGEDGDLMSVILARTGLRLDEVFLTNVVKDVPLDQDLHYRSPTKQEIDQGLPGVVGEGRRVQPKFVLILGRSTAGMLFPRTLRTAGGRFRDLRGLTFPRGGMLWMFTWHPRQVLRNPLMQDEFALDLAMFGQAVLDSRTQQVPSHSTIVIPRY